MWRYAEHMKTTAKTDVLEDRDYYELETFVNTLEQIPNCNYSIKHSIQLYYIKGEGLVDVENPE